MTAIPASHTRPLDAASMVLVVFICLTWGFNQPAIKLAIHDVPPLIQCAIRSSLATLMVLALMRWRGLPVTARDGIQVSRLQAGARGARRVRHGDARAGAAGTPMVVAYKVDAVIAPALRLLIKAPSVVLANLVLDENAFPELHAGAIARAANLADRAGAVAGR